MSNNEIILSIIVAFMSIIVIAQWIHSHFLINKLMSHSYWEYERVKQLPKQQKLKIAQPQDTDRLDYEDMSILNDVKVN